MFMKVLRHCPKVLPSRTHTFVLLLSFLCASFTQAQTILPDKFVLAPNPIELTRTTRPQQYIEAVGRKAALFGHENGVFESWVFPIKLFHDAHLSVQVEGQDTSVDFADNLERIIARPEATTLIASNQLFTIRAHFLTPINEAGSLVLLDIDTARPLILTVSFVPDIKPMWPGGLGGQAAYWRDDMKAFILTESRRKINGFFGSPAATKGVATPAHQLGADALRFDIKVDPQQARKSFYPLVIAGNTKDRQTAIDLYNKLASTIPDQYQKTFAHYRRLREEMLSVETPDEKINLAFEWAKVSLDKGMVDNPDLGLGLVAGWNATGDGARPGFGWFFGGDAAINSYAMTAYGDFENVKATFRFLAKYQRADGKIAHEISQSAGMIKWFEDFPYAYYHADTTPSYLAAVYNYYQQSGDTEFIKELWPIIKKAYQFCVDNDTDSDGILENSKAGLGASELGSLLNDLHQDIYLAATNTEASRAMIELAKLMKDEPLSKTAAENYAKASKSIKERYWNASENRYAYALTKSGKQNMEVTAWTAVPMLFGQFDRARVNNIAAELASSQLSSDWGVRMLSNRSPTYDPMAYNNGGVWPFLTGFVALGEYKYQRLDSAFAHLKQVANLTFDFALGYHPEILSGDFYRPLDESVPHQLFSSGMVITPLIKGLLGLGYSIETHQLGIAPQLPASWDYVKVKNLRIGNHLLNFEVKRIMASGYQLEIEKKDGAALEVVFNPLFSLMASVSTVGVNGQGQGSAGHFNEPYFRVATIGTLQRRAAFNVSWNGGVDIDVPENKLQMGDRTTFLKVVSVSTTSAKKIMLQVEGLADKNYLLRVRTKHRFANISGASLKGEKDGWKILETIMPANDKGGWQMKTIEVEFKQ